MADIDHHNISETRKKIYEQIDYLPKPENYNSRIPWVVQQQISATNGVHYADKVGKLNDYPIFELPVKEVDNGLFLDIGCGWGRWLVGGHNKGYIPIGIDIRLEFCKTSQVVLKDLDINGYTVVADLENIPFKEDIFDLIWSFSAIQHTHYNRLINCLEHINRMLSPKGGYTKLEFPNKTGIRNSISNVKNSEKTKDDYNSWCVRYYSPEEYKSIFNKYLSNFSYSNHSFLGIGVLKEDVKYVSLKHKLPCLASLALSNLTQIFPPLKKYSDSLYIKAEKKATNKGANTSSISAFLNAHGKSPENNLNIISLLRCPTYGSDIILSNDKTKAISKGNNIYYPIKDNIPIMIASEALSLENH